MSSSRHRAAAVALAGAWLLAPGPAAAQEAATLVCSVAGYDVMIENQGNAPVAAGTRIGWSVPFARSEGEHVLEAPLAPGGRVFLSTALGASFLDPGKACEITSG